MQRPTQAVILAGGRGTRLRPLTDTRPKAMIEFHGKPFLGYLVEMLRDQGFRRLLLLLGYLPDVIIDHFGDGSGYGVEIEYDVTGPDDLTGFRVRHACDRLDDVFLQLYCDNYWPMRFDAMWRSFLDSGVARNSRQGPTRGLSYRNLTQPASGPVARLPRGNVGRGAATGCSVRPENQDRRSQLLAFGCRLATVCEIDVAQTLNRSMLADAI